MFNALELRPVCEVCLKPLARNEHLICNACEYKRKEWTEIRNKLRPFNAGKLQIRTQKSGEHYHANCPLCGNKCEVLSITSFIFDCKNCGYRFYYYNTLPLRVFDLERKEEVDYNFDAWTPYFDKIQSLGERREDYETQQKLKRSMLKYLLGE